MTEIQARVKALQARIFIEKYYDMKWHDQLAEQKITVEQVNDGKLSDRDLIMLVNDFWEALPDFGVIRSGPFFEICAIAEMMFD